jgi:YegS/Rv2252/BmrU family lipid kinase
MAKTAVVMNPRSAGGRTGEVWGRLRSQLAAFGGEVALFATDSPGHGIRLAGDAVRAGFGRIVAVGGDGTLNEVVNGVLSASPDSAAAAEVGLIPQGTGSDLRRTLGIPLMEADAIAVLHQGKIRAIDVMKVTFTRPDGAEDTRYAVNVTSFGMGGQVAARANRSGKALGGRITFLLATVSTALAFRGDRVSLEMDDGGLPDVRITNVAAGNGRFHGSGMEICPRASIDDGLLDVTVVGRLSVAELVWNLPKLFDGRVYEHRKVSFHRTTRLSAESLEGDSAIEIDGEPLGRLPLRIEVLPGALRMVVP